MSVHHFEDEESGERRQAVFDEATEARLVAGRAFEISGMPARALVALKRAIDVLGARNGLSLEVVPGGDHTGTGPGPDDTTYCTCVIGLPAGRGGTYEADVIERSLALDTLATARAISSDLWGEVDALLPPDERAKLRASAVALHLACVGPLAAARLAFGVEGAEDDEDMPGEYLSGQTMEQEAFDAGVWGLEVGYVQYESPDVVSLDFSDEAHARRVRELGRDDGRYFLLAQYD